MQPPTKRRRRGASVPPPPFYSEQPGENLSARGFLRLYGAPLFFGFVLLVAVGGTAMLLWSTPAADLDLTPEELRIMERAARGEPIGDSRILGAGGAPGGLSALDARAARLDPGAAREVGSYSGEIRVDSEPAGARVSLDGVTEGHTPLRLDGLRSRYYLVSVDSPGFIVKDTLVLVDQSEATVISLALAPIAGLQEELSPARAEERRPGPDTPAAPGSETGRLSIRAAPEGVAVRVNGRRVGTAPLELNVSPGVHAVSLSRQGYESASVEVEVRPGGREGVEVELAPQRGSLTVVVRPWGSIYIDGVLRARDTDVSVDVNLPAGQHRVRAEHPALGSQERTVEVRAGESASITIDLN